MPVLPDTREEKISFFEARAASWITNAVLVGITPVQAASIKNLATEARNALNDANEVRIKSKSKTAVYYDATREMNALGRDLIATIKAFAETTGNVAVYDLSDISPPSPPSPVPAPSTPTDLAGTLDASGILSLVWKSDRSGPSSGIIFEVSRCRGIETAFTLVGATFEKTCIDPTFIACNGNASYRIQARRGLLHSGFAGPLQITMGGAGGGGGFSQTLTCNTLNNGDMRMAA